MSEEQAKRKLAAILSADATDYNRLMEDDVEATDRTITAYLELMVSQIQNQVLAELSYGCDTRTHFKGK